MVDWGMYDVGDNKLMQQLALRFYSRHLISLAGFRQPIDRNDNPIGNAKGFSYSGFLLTIRGVWCLVTAGHIIKKLDKHLNDKTIHLTNSVIIDGWGLEAQHKQPFYFDYQRAPRMFVLNNEYRLDFAIIMLKTYYQRLLEANHVVPISEVNWARQHNLSYEEHFVLGLPTELMESTENEGIEQLRPVPTIIPVTKLDHPPERHETPYPQFVGKIFDNVTLKDMDGMSGGPIIGIAKAKDGKRRYWIVAIQSRWIRSKRIVFGCPVPIFAGLVEQEVVALEKERLDDSM